MSTVLYGTIITQQQGACQGLYLTLDLKFESPDLCQSLLLVMSAKVGLADSSVQLEIAQGFVPNRPFVRSISLFYSAEYFPLPPEPPLDHTGSKSGRVGETHPSREPLWPISSSEIHSL